MRVVVVGSGKAGAAYLRAFSAVRGVEVIAVVSRSANCVEHEVVRTIDEAVRLRPDLAAIATPHDQHAHEAAAFLASGAHVIVEKPAALSHKDLAGLLDAASTSRRQIFCGFVQRSAPAVIACRELLEGKAPEIKGVWIEQLLDRPSGYYLGWKGDATRAGGGVLMNQAIHAVDTALNVLPAECIPVVVRCRFWTTRTELSVEDSVTAELRTSTGFPIFLTASTALTGHNQQHVRVTTDDETLVLGGTELPALVRAAPHAQGDVELQLANLAGQANDFENAHAPMVRDVVTALRAGRATESGVELALCRQVHEVVFGLYESASRGGADISLRGGAD